MGKLDWIVMTIGLTILIITAITGMINHHYIFGNFELIEEGKFEVVEYRLSLQQFIADIQIFFAVVGFAIWGSGFISLTLTESKDGLKLKKEVLS